MKKREYPSLRWVAASRVEKISVKRCAFRREIAGLPPIPMTQVETPVALHYN